MQREAAAVYFALFIVLGAGAYGFIQVGVTEPTVDLGPDELGNGDTLTVDGRTYTVENVGRESTEEGEGPITGQLRWLNESAVGTASLENASRTTYEGETYNVSIVNRTDVSAFSLVAVQNVTAILRNDPAVENETGTIGGTRYVFFTDGDRQPLAEYLPEPATVGPFDTADTFPYETDNGTVDADIAEVTPEAVSLVWSNPTEETIQLSEARNLTLNGVPYFVHFTDADSVEVLPRDRFYDEFTHQLRVQDAWGERVAGLWGIVIIALLASILLLAAAYMPVKS